MLSRLTLKSIIVSGFSILVLMLVFTSYSGIDSAQQLDRQLGWLAS